MDALATTPAKPDVATDSTALDEPTLQAFEGRLVGALNDAAMMLMVSVGHRTGLFDRLAGRDGVTSIELARAAGLHERYVREWLGAMVASGIVEIRPDRDSYRLPAEHAALLTRSGPANLAAMAQYIPLLGSVEDDVVHCFRNGGGVPYARYGRFHEIMEEDSGQTVLPALVGDILPLVPGLVERLTSGIDVLDAGCGRGGALLLLARTFPNSRFTGWDLSDAAIGWARERARTEGLDNVTFESRDLSDFDCTAPEGAFDLVTTFDAIHDQARPLALLKGIRHALAEGGVYIAQDVQGTSHHHGDKDHPLATLLYTVSCMHCMAVSLAQGGEGLGAMWGRKTAEKYLRAAGFSSVTAHELAHDIQNFYYVCRP